MTAVTNAQPTVSFADIEAARDRIRGQVVRTPLFPSEALSKLTNCRLSLKAENFQKTGAFKARGALNAIALLTPEERHRGVVTFSAGNHGQGLAFAASTMSAACTVFMAHNAMPTKVEAIRGFGAQIRQFPTIQEAVEQMETMQRDTGAVFVSPFGDPAVIAGQATVGLEIVEDLPEVEQIIVPVGGGGLIAGIAFALATLRPDARIVGVEPEGAAAMSEALTAGSPVRLEQVSTIADGLAAPFTCDLNLAIVKAYVDDIVILTDDEIVDSMRLMLHHCKLLAEPAGAAGLAALVTGKAAVPVGADTVAIVTGGNIDLPKLKALL
ncbi:threonine ammonia-lyase [soil metagenome]